MRRLLVCFAVLAGACAPWVDRAQNLPTSSGPPRVRLEVVRRHAEQFDEELGHRAAGSQQELAAATYLLGHLQKAGFVTRLEAVPVEDLVRSTNVIALPPGVDEPEVFVVVGYDTESARGRHGLALGLFLELARALRVAAPDARVAFAALGAEHTELRGGRLGSRRLADQLLEDDLRPFVLTLGRVGFGAPAVVSGDVERLPRDAPGSIRLRGTPLPAGSTAEVFDAAGFDHAWVAAPPDVLAPLLLEFLSGRRG